jgi:MFS family permease
LLYASLGGAFFFLPFLLIQVHGFSATLAGAAFLPFTIIMAVLSRSSGGLIDRFGARLPLIVGPAVAAVGFVLLPLAGGTYGALLAPMIVLGLGMAITVAPLTTTVINAVPQRQAGVASGINNAVASLASLLAVAIFGAIALEAHNRGIDRLLTAQPLSAEARQAVAGARGKFAAEFTIEGADRRKAETIVRQSLADSITLVMWLAAALALAASISAALTIRPQRGNAVSAAGPA